MNPRVPATLLLLLSAALSAAEQMRFWTNTSGQIIEAEMTGVDAVRRVVLVRLKDGKTAEIPIEQLSPPDREHAKTEWAKIQSGASPRPATLPAAGMLDVKKLPPRYHARFSADARLKAILECGGTQDVEQAVIRSLQLFKSSQSTDGSWGRANKAAMTGFALQCFLGHGETVDSPEYGDTVAKGLAYLISLSKQNPHGLLTESWQAGKFTGTYEHAIASTAVSEALVLGRGGATVPAGLPECFHAAVKCIIRQQSRLGAWGYTGKDMCYNPDTGSDLSVANWHLHALAAAQDTGLRVEGIDACIRKALNFVESKQTRDGGFGGANRDAHYNQWHLSGGAAAGHLLLSPSIEKAAQKSVQFIAGLLAAAPPSWDSNCNLYSWHGYAYALRLHGGPEWKTFATRVMPQIIAAQELDGSFKRGRADWPASDAADPTYRQALCTLILESSYRLSR